jgi:hypothetical protein
MRQLLNQLTKDNKKVFARKIGKLAHNNPLLVFNDIVSFLTKDDYDNNIPTVVYCLQYCTNLSLDILVFLILRFIYD